MPESWQRLIEAVHQSPVRCVIVVTGGGASAISDLLVVPGGSRTILEAAVPYSPAALTAWLGRPPEHFCSEETALAMAAVAFERGQRFYSDQSARQTAAPARESDSASRSPGELSIVAGVACTAALVSDRPKKGEHRCHVALQTADRTASATLVLRKGARNRSDEERLVGRLILSQLATLAGVENIPHLDLLPEETVAGQQTLAAPLLVELRGGRRQLVWSFPDGALAATLEPFAGNRTGSDPMGSVRGVLCGAFNPLHFGHRQLREAAELWLGGPVYYELSLRNVDKPPLDYLTIDRRRAQFTDVPLALTSAPTFAEKADALPGMTFVVGVDTAERIIQPRYYGGAPAGVAAALAHLRERKCRFLVAGRQEGGRFLTLADLPMNAEFADLFEALPADRFRADISSTELRRRDQTSRPVE